MRTFTFGMILALAVLSASVAGGELKTLPDDVLLMLEFRNPDQIAVDIQTFAETMQPGLTTEFVQAGLGAMFLSSDFGGLRSDGVFKLLMLDRRKHPKPTVLVAPLLDKDIYSDVIGERFKGAMPDKRDGLTVFTTKTQHFDREAYNKAQAKKKPGINRRQYTTEVTVERFLGTAPSMAVLADDASACKHVLELIKTGKLKDGPAVDIDGAFAMKSSPGALLECYSDDIAAWVKSTKDTFSRAFGVRPAKGGPDADQTAALFELEINTAVDIAKQVRAIDFAAKIDLDGIAFTQRIEPQPGSKLAAFLAKQKPVDQAALKLLPPDTIAVVDMSVSGLDTVTEPYIELMEKFFAAMQPEGKEPLLTEETKTLMKDLIAVYDGEYAFAWVRCPGGDFGLDLVYVATVTDAQRARDMMAKYIATFNTLKDAYKEMGMAFEMEPIEGELKHRGVDITGFSYKFKLPEDAGGQDGINKMLGDGMRFYLAFVGKRQLMAFGKNAKKMITSTIDRSIAGGESLSDNKDFQAALAKLAGDDDDELMASAYWSTGELCRWLASSGGEGADIYFGVDPGPGLVVRAGRNGSVWTKRMTLPMREILTIRSAIDAATEAMMQRHQNQPPMVEPKEAKPEPKE